MPYKRQTPEQIAFARTRQREYNARYRASVKGRQAHSRGQAKFYEAHKDELSAAKRAVCIVCGGPKEPGRGFRKCNKCWGIRPEGDLDALIASQASDMWLGEFQPPQRFGDTNRRDSHVVPIDWRDDLPDDVWSDPTADEALG
jgi:hypothetical protein